MSRVGSVGTHVAIMCLTVSQWQCSEQVRPTLISSVEFLIFPFSIFYFPSPGSRASAVPGHNAGALDLCQGDLLNCVSLENDE